MLLGIGEQILYIGSGSAIQSDDAYSHAIGRHLWMYTMTGDIMPQGTFNYQVRYLEDPR